MTTPGAEMVNRENGLSLRLPGLPNQTIDALEIKLISQPRFEGMDIFIALRAVPSHVRTVGILEYPSQSHASSGV